MKTLGRALSAELLKLKRTLALWLVLIAPLTVVLLQFMMMWQRSGGKTRVVADAWGIVSMSTYSFYAVGMLPLFITLETALLGALEHGPKAWKHLFALPIPRVTVYIAKMLIAAALIGASCLVLILGTVISGYALSLLVAGADFSAGPQWLLLLHRAAAIFLASWLILALHSWIAFRWSSFALASGAGMTATVGIALIASSQRWWKFYPWSFPMHASGASGNMQLAVLLGSVGGFLVATLACWDIARRDVTS